MGENMSEYHGGEGESEAAYMDGICDNCGNELRRDDSHIRCQLCIDKLKKEKQRKALMKIFHPITLRDAGLTLEDIINAVENPDEVLDG